ncbi:MAG: SLC13/DASS family transporter [Acidobacteria bacterium]|nr:SLC13/DASS family transporter [Acidobacteriota bacterium]
MRSKIGALLGPLAFVVIWFMEMPLPPEAHRLAAVAALVIIYWITEPVPIPVTALLGSALCILVGVAPAQIVLAPYADPIIFLFLGAFLVGEAMVSAGLDARVAHSVLAIPALSSTPLRLTVTLSFLTMALSMWMSNTAAAAIMMPLALSMIRTRQTGGHSSVGGDTVVLSVAYAASIGGIATPIGTPPNLIAIGFLERNSGFHLGFLPWMKLGLPLALFLMLALFLLSAVTLRRARGGAHGAPGRLPAWTRAEKSVAAVFACMVLTWLLPSILGFLAPAHIAEVANKRLPESAVALFGALALFMLPEQTRPYRPVLKWEQTARIDWGTILLFGGGLSLGGLVLSTGLGKWAGELVLRATGVQSHFGLIALAAGTAVVLTEFMSNTAATNVVIPVVYAMATGMNLDPTTAVLAAAFGASMGFMFPIGTPPNAIAYGTGLVTIPQMIRRGVLFDAMAFVVIATWVTLVRAR